MWARTRAGVMPAQHLWGVDALAAAGHDLDFAPFHEPGERNLLDRISDRSRRLLGHLDQEAYAARRIARTDIVYCADQMGSSGLAIARKLVRRTKLVAVVHHPIRHPLRLAAAARQDVLICLSERLKEEIDNGLPRRRGTVVALPWGPDLKSALYVPDGESNGVVSGGKANRDLKTLVRALEAAGAHGLVYDLARTLPSRQDGPVKLVRPGERDGVDPNSPGGYLARQVIGDIAKAAIVAIPVADPDRLTGLTEAVDALALAKPIVATRSPYFPFDLEAVGCGIWVDPGDVAGWTRAISELTADAARRQTMGAAGRAFAESEWSYERFCAGLAELFAA
jgi:glycosyltransferase involved in cell wall biosynthesis